MNWFETITKLYVRTVAALALMLAGGAPAIILSYSLYLALKGQGFEWWVATGAGIALAVTMEGVGVVTAHVSQHNPARQRAASVLLVIYTVLGLGYMQLAEKSATIRNIGTMAYLVAPMAYYAASLLTAVAEETKQQAQVQAEAKRREEIEYRRQVAERQAEREHQLELARLREETKRHKAEQETARPVQVTPPQLAANSPQESDNEPEGYTHWRTIPAAMKRQMATMTTGEIAEMYPSISPRTAREWRKRAVELATSNPAPDGRGARRE